MRSRFLKTYFRGIPRFILKLVHEQTVINMGPLFLGVHLPGLLSERQDLTILELINVGSNLVKLSVPFLPLRIRRSEKVLRILAGRNRILQKEFL